MQNQSISVFEAATIILVSLVVLLTMVEPCSASHITMNMNQPSLGLTLLQSLDHTPIPTPGNGCSETGKGGNPCKPPVNEKAFAGRNWATATTPSPPPPSLLLSVETTTNRKLMMWSHGA
ncbi:hypothetical protein L1987_21940 [Smallanthus sonchifolius]|uniref:Uncharacterized protein n=1 Tax=Smallanthus sonchifolius TaxID=185202 RepID=A0ACB9ICR7_9ASTR|nr:hypothetical protein L1987_21940 [Smallanthus sonchifolius]